MNTGKRNTMLHMLEGLTLTALLLGSAQVLADEPVAAGAPAQEAAALPEARPLATVEAILDYCARLDTVSADKYRQEVSLVAQGADEDTLSQIRASDEYRQAHGEMDEFLAKVDPRNAKKICAQHLAQNP